MRKLAILAVLAATASLIGADMALARGGRGGCGSSCGSSGCGYGGYSRCGVGYGGGCGVSYGGCGTTYGGCGVSYGGCGVSYGGCGTAVYGGYCAPTVGYGCQGAVPAHPMPPAPMKDGKKIDMGSLAAPATLIVNLPADATLKVDDYQTVSKSETRVFTTPELAPGKDFVYTLKAEVIRDGKPVVVEQVVKVRAGETTPITLNLGAATGVASR